VTAAVSNEHSEAYGGGSAQEAGAQRLGTVVAGTYRLTHLIGSGASSHVFEAKHVRLGSAFALKLLRAELSDKRAGQRFRHEATAIARLCSEHVVSVLDCGELDEGAPFLVMERLQGEDLRRLLGRAAPLPPVRAINLAIQACRGLAVVHQAGLVHRDLKPENLFVTRRGTGEDWCKILDFGVAKLDFGTSTLEGALLGTVRYMAPEQLVSATSARPATDVYAIGAILFECVTGRALIRGENVHESMYQILNVETLELIAAEPSLPSSLRPVILACLEKNPERRPQSAAELEALLLEALRAPAAIGETTLLEDDAEPSMATAPSPRGMSPLTCAVAAISVGLGGLLLGWRMATPADHPHVSIDRMAEATQNARLEVKPAMAHSPPSSPAESLAPAPPSASAVHAPPKAPAMPRRLAGAVVGSPSIAKASPPTEAQKEPSRPTTVERFDAVNPYGK
jgi:eukaryotic-like serine/threonine-protein kinase